MKAVILAAGRGSRLAPLTDEKPKGLIELGGETLIQREIRLLVEHGFDKSEIYVLTGYRSAQIERVWPSIVHNELWNTKENAYSVLLALEKLGNDDFIFLDSDLVFDGSLLDEVLGCAYPNVLSCMRSGDLSESTGIEVDRRGFAIRIGKQVKDSGLVYTSVFRIGANTCESYARALLKSQNQSTWYTEAMNDVFREAGFYALASDAAWMEVDDFVDLDRARIAFEEGAIR